MTRIIDFGKHKGKILADCDEKYLKWLISHEKVLALRNRWACRDAKFILDRRAQLTITATGNTNWNEWSESLKRAEMDVKIAKHRASTPAKVDLGLKGNLNTSRAFSILR
jgi:hypothetical protein